jgi:hypothetical protein
MLKTNCQSQSWYLVVQVMDALANDNLCAFLSEKDGAALSDTLTKTKSPCLNMVGYSRSKRIIPGQHLRSR